MSEMLLAADSGVPQRDVLLNVAAMQRHLSPLFSGNIGLPHAKRIKYRPGESLRVVYSVPRQGAADAMVTARTVPQGSKPTDDCAARSGASCSAIGTRFWTFPNDRRLSHIGAMLRPRADLSQALGGEWVESRVAGYAPEKAVVVACLDRHRRTIAYAKHYVSLADARRAYRLHADLWRLSAGGRPPLRLPRPLALDDRWHLVITECATGARLTDVPSSDEEPALARLGAATARFHQIPVPDGVPAFERFTAASLAQAAEIVARACPVAACDVRTVVNALAVFESDDDERVVLHGDLHLKNAMADGDSVWLIDLDQASTGPAAAEIGSVLALVRSRVAAGLLTPGLGDRLEGAFLAGYAATRPLPSARSISRFTAAALVAERAARAVSRVRRPLLRRMAAVIAQAREAVGRGERL